MPAMRRLTFAGNPTVVIAAGRQVVSDAVRVPIPHDSDVLITTYSPTPSGPATYHAHARQISYTAEGDQVADVTGGPYTTQSLHWRYVTALDVLSNESAGTVVVLGDSLTDGVTSTAGENRPWTDVLAGRLRTVTDPALDQHIRKLFRDKYWVAWAGGLIGKGPKETYVVEALRSSTP